MVNYNNNMLRYISAPKFDWPDLLRNILKFEFQQKHSRQNIQLNNQNMKMP